MDRQEVVNALAGELYEYQDGMRKSIRRMDRIGRPTLKTGMTPEYSAEMNRYRTMSAKEEAIVLAADALEIGHEVHQRTLQIEDEVKTVKVNFERKGA